MGRRTREDDHRDTCRRAKGVAGAQGISLKQLFVEALEEKLRRRIAGVTRSEPPWLKLAGAFGGSAAARAGTRRIQERIDDEFEMLEPEDQV